VLRPARSGGAGGAQHPLAKRDDQSGVFGERNEIVGCDHPTLRMPPAHQRLESRDLPAARPGLGLIEDLELLLHECLTQVVLQGAPCLQACIHGWLEHAKGAAAIRLGVVKRGVGVAQQRLGIAPIGGEQRNAYADAAHHHLAVQLERLRDCRDQALRERGRTLGLVET
jgi:hypothetical protein